MVGFRNQEFEGQTMKKLIAVAMAALMIVMLLPFDVDARGRGGGRGGARGGGLNSGRTGGRMNDKSREDEQRKRDRRENEDSLRDDMGRGR
jgi:hypothetical protein